MGDISLAIKNIGERQVYETDYWEKYIVPFLFKHYDSNFEKATRTNGAKMLAEFLPCYEASNIPIPFDINNLEKLNKKETNNILGLFAIYPHGLRVFQYQKYQAINAKLLLTLRNEYHTLSMTVISNRLPSNVSISLKTVRRYHKIGKQNNAELKMS